VQYRQRGEHFASAGLEFDQLWVAVYVGNDFYDSVWNKDVPVHDGILGHRGDLRSALKTSLHLYRLLTGAYHRLAGDAAPSVYDSTLDELATADAWGREPLDRAAQVYEAEMEKIALLARDARAELRVVVLPTREAVDAKRGQSPRPGKDPLLPVARATAALKRLGVAHLDVAGALAGSPTRDTYFAFDGHLTPEGNRLVAQAILDRWGRDCAPLEDRIGAADR